MSTGSSASKTLAKKERKRTRRIIASAIMSPTEFFDMVSQRWGRSLVTRCETEKSMSSQGKSGQSTAVYVSFQNFPYMIIGSKGVGMSKREAELNCFHNFLSSMLGCISQTCFNQIKQHGALCQSCYVDELFNAILRLESAYLSSQYQTKLRHLGMTDTQSSTLKSYVKNLKADVRETFRLEANDNKPSPSKRAATAMSSQDRAAASVVGASGDTTEPQAKKLKIESPLKSRRPEMPSTSSGANIECIELSDDEDYNTNDGEDDSVAVEKEIDEEDEDEHDRDRLPLSEYAEQAINEANPMLNISNFPEPSERLGDRSIGAKMTDSDFANMQRSLIGVTVAKSAYDIAKRVQQYKEKYEEGMKKLTDEIWLHFNVNGQNDQVYTAKMDVRQLLISGIQATFSHPSTKHMIMYAVGSTVNGCGSYNSDMDLCLCVPDKNNQYDQTRSKALTILRHLNGLFKTNPRMRTYVKSSQLISAKVPIIKVFMKTPYEDMDIDININNVAGIYNSHLLHYYSRLDPRFSALCLLVKHWAINSDISDAMTGTFNSYSIILLVAHFLQCGVVPAVLPNLQYLFPNRFAAMPPLSKLELFKALDVPERPENHASLGELLVGFFYYYAEFDFSQYAISIREGNTYNRRILGAESRKFYIFIEEPFDGKNTARCVTRSDRMNRIQEAFRHARHQFTHRPPDLATIKVRV